MAGTIRVIRVGSFAGRWHDDPVKFDIEKVFPDAKFKGTGTFAGGPHAGSAFIFTGQLFGFGSLTIERGVDGGTQTAKAGEFLIKNNYCIWQAPTTGPGAGDRLFELRVPSLVKIGTFDGKWHGDAVTFRFVQIFEPGQFNGIAKFIGGPHNGIEFGFAGGMEGTGGVRINRETGVGTQSVITSDPRLIGNMCVWQAPTTGPGAGDRPFELRIPI